MNTDEQRAFEEFYFEHWPYGETSPYAHNKGCRLAWQARGEYEAAQNADKPDEGVVKWRYEIQHGPDGEENYAWLYRNFEMVATMRVHTAKEIVAALSQVKPTPTTQPDNTQALTNAVEHEVISRADGFGYRDCSCGRRVKDGEQCVAPVAHAGRPDYKKPVCRGSWALGSACGKCERCIATASLPTPSDSVKQGEATGALTSNTSPKNDPELMWALDEEEAVEVIKRELAGCTWPAFGEEAIPRNIYRALAKHTAAKE